VRLRDNGERSIGAKRNELLYSVDTPYLTFIDDDDTVAPDYVRRVLDSFLVGADLVGFNLVRDDDGVFGERHARGLCGPAPAHLCPIRTEYAQAIGYRDMNDGEDADYTARLKATFPRLREHFIADDLYFYHRRHDRTGEIVNAR
jgi:hypothetical protein